MNGICIHSGYFVRLGSEIQSTTDERGIGTMAMAIKVPFSTPSPAMFLAITA